MLLRNIPEITPASSEKRGPSSVPIAEVFDDKLHLELTQVHATLFGTYHLGI